MEKNIWYNGTTNKYDINVEKTIQYQTYRFFNKNIEIKTIRTKSILNFYKIIKEQFEKNGYQFCEIVRYKYPYKHYCLKFTKGDENNMHETIN